MSAYTLSSGGNYMKKIGILVFAVALVVGLVVVNIFSFGQTSGRFFNFSVNFKGVKGSGNVSKDVRNAADFKGVDVGGVFQVEITAQKDFAVEIEADDNLLQYIRTDVRNGVLHIEADKKLRPSKPMRIRISAPAIDRLDVSGVANVTLNDVRSDALHIDSSGASKIRVTGEATKFTVDVSGATKVDAEELKVENANVEASGASKVAVSVTGELRADASGASKVTYTGSPLNVDRTTSGASRVGPKE